MDWLLIVVLAWASTPPTTVLEIPVATEELCQEAARKVEQDLSANAVGDSVGQTVTVGKGVVTTCLRTAANQG